MKNSQINEGLEFIKQQLAGFDLPKLVPDESHRLHHRFVLLFDNWLRDYEKLYPANSNRRKDDEKAQQETA